MRGQVEVMGIVWVVVVRMMGMAAMKVLQKNQEEL
jgi:tryptophan-rich sensory protein